MQEAAFWEVVEAARATVDGDALLMADALTARFADADDETLRGFQSQLVAAHGRSYTWRHGSAAEMVCGFVSDDVFTDWRSWIISRGRETFERVAVDPDDLADVEPLPDGCEGVGESFGSAVADIYHHRHGYEDERFPAVEPSEPPSGERLTDPTAIRRTLPRLSARVPKDGLGRGPGSFAEDAREPAPADSRCQVPWRAHGRALPLAVSCSRLGVLPTLLPPVDRHVRHVRLRWARASDSPVSLVRGARAAAPPVHVRRVLPPTRGRGGPVRRAVNSSGRRKPARLEVGISVDLTLVVYRRI